MGLEEVGGFEVGGKIGCDELLVLTAGLDIVSEGIVQCRAVSLQRLCLCPTVRSNALRCS